MDDSNKHIVAMNDRWLFEQLVPTEESSIVNIMVTNSDETWYIEYDMINGTLECNNGYSTIYRGQEVIDKFGITFDFNRLQYKNIIKPKRIVSTIMEYFEGKNDTWDNGNGISVILTEPLDSYNEVNNLTLNVLLKHIGFLYSKETIQIYVDHDNLTFVKGNNTLNVPQKKYSYGILVNILGRYIVYDEGTDTIVLINGDNLKRFSCKHSILISDFVDKINSILVDYQPNDWFDLIKFDYEGNLVLPNHKYSLSNPIAIKILLDRIIGNRGLINQIKEKFGENTKIILMNDKLIINGKAILLNKLPTIENIMNDMVDIRNMNNILESKLH